MKNTNISQLGCSTLGEQIEKNRERRIRNLWYYNFFLLGVDVGLIISFLTIPR